MFTEHYSRTLIAAVLMISLCAACTDSAPPPAPASSEEVAESESSAQEAAKQAPELATEDEQADSELADTSWELVQIQSMDDTTWTTSDPSRYTLVLEADGAAYMQLDCNRGRSGWSSEGPSLITFKPVASTNALCQDEGLSERYAAQFEWVRSYVMRDGNLYLATMADGAILEFRPAQAQAAESG